MMKRHRNHRPPNRHGRALGCLAGVAVVMVTGLGAAAPTQAATPEKPAPVQAAPGSPSAPGASGAREDRAPGATHDRLSVHPGQSIQKAVDAARPGDTVVVHPGTYRESIHITTSDVTLRGTGPSTVLMPPAATDKRAAHACATAGHGVCVTGTEDAQVRGVSVRSLKLTGFAAAGLWASRTDRLSVRQVTAEKNGTWGLAQEKSTRAQIRDNIARDNRDAGVFLANTVGEEGGATDTAGTRVSDNDLTGNRVGINIKRVRNLTAHDNDISGNCAGIFVVSDESKPAAGAMTIRGNTIRENNKLCPASPRLPAIQGSGIVLTGSDATVIRGNRVLGNVGTAPMSGGIVLFESFVGATNENNVIEDNEVTGNGKADLVHRGPGGGNSFARNVCESSEPSGMC
ncbi:nitrous oxide reductase family maturation protein NosD [Streptomyces sp. NPDC051018]|uniref:nitrous oxide reductase family maturation protein NosD n=1 Tax=Streptomyces sp. NPDC051018 TaxID=3365639 RepID=UPI0037BB96C2